MAGETDRLLVESVHTHRKRLRQAFLLGRINSRREINDNTGRILGSLVLAAVSCAVCVGISFVLSMLNPEPAHAAPEVSESIIFPTGSEEENNG